MKDKILNYIKQNNMIKQGDTVIVGVSGGADSMFLLTILMDLKKELSISIHVVHINHQIRGDEALRDQEYVKQFCENSCIPFHLFSLDVTAMALKAGQTVEEAGRIARYESFAKIKAELSEKIPLENIKIAVAHNSNDVAETVVLNMTRGTGIEGMKGIAPVRDDIIRPILNVSRGDIEAYLEKTGVEYKTDSTNLSVLYTRNKVRHIILPAMEELNKKAVDHIVNMAETAGLYSDFVNEAKEKWCLENVVIKKNINGQETRTININNLQNSHLLIRQLVLKDQISWAAKGPKDIGKNHVIEVEKLLLSDSGAQLNLPHGGKVTKNYEGLVFERKACVEIVTTKYMEEIFVPFQSDAFVDAGSFDMSFKRYKRPDNLDLTKNLYTKFVDYDKILSRISIRNIRPDDYIIIDSEGNRKKLSRLFTDCKLERELRKNVPLVACGSEIIWAVGLRLSEKYKITEDTTNILEITFKTKE